MKKHDTKVQQNAVILLIEDNPDHAEMVRRHFEVLGIMNPVTQLLDGEVAIQYLTRQCPYGDPAGSPLPCLVLLDLRLPKVDGLEVLKIIKNNEHLRLLPVVVLTTSEATSDLERAYGLGVDGYLVKPLDLSQFKKLIGKILPDLVYRSCHGKKNGNEK